MGLFDSFKSKPQSSSEQSADEKKLADFIKKKVEDVRTAGNRIAHEGQWMTNVAYLLGFDSVFYDTQNRQFRSVDGAARPALRRNRVFNNLILPAVQNRQARLCKQMPKFEIRPEDNSNEAKDRARLERQIALQLWDECDLNVKRLLLTMWLQECGHAYLKVGWDDEVGNELTDPMSGEFMGYEGAVDVNVVSAFEVFPDPLAVTEKECQWVVQAKARKLDYFRTRYPERGHLVREEGAWLLSIQYEQRIQTLSTSGLGSSGTQQQMENAAIELSYYEKRSRKHPKGRHVVVANGVVLKDGPLAVGEIPFVKFDDVLVAGKYYSEATITHARPLQDQYNRTLTRRAMWTNRLLAGKYLAARGHGLMEESLNDQSGEVVEYDPVPGASEPAAMQIPVIPQYAYQETDQLEKSLYNIFGLGDVSRGQIPAAGIPAVGMQLLLEQDETRIGIEVEQHEHAYARTVQLMLMYANKFTKTPRKLTEQEGEDILIREYTGEDIDARPDVKVVRGSTVPTSTSMRRQEIINAMQLGLLGNPQDPQVQEKILGMMEFADTDGLWQDSALDSAQAKREMAAIKRGEVVDVNKLDNHPFMIKKLNDFRKSDAGVALDDNQRAALEATIDLHAEFAAQLSNPQIESMEQNVDDGLRPDGAPPEEDVIEEPIVEEAVMGENELSGA